MFCSQNQDMALMFVQNSVLDRIILFTKQRLQTHKDSIYVLCSVVKAITMVSQHKSCFEYFSRIPFYETIISVFEIIFESTKFDGKIY